MILHIFNPEHDMALAANNPFWTAPHAGRQMRADLGWIPAVWASDGDIILVDNKDKAEEASKKKPFSNRNVKYIELNDIKRNSILLHSITEVMPWGWDDAIRMQLIRNGLSEDLLPDHDKIALIRELSGRKTAARLLTSLSHTEPRLTGEAHDFTSLNDVARQVSAYGQAVIKTPWSCSGRGVRYVRENPRTGERGSGVIDKNTGRWIENALERQGHVMVEPYYEKVKDFGMEFTAMADGSVRYDGLSLFRTLNGAYLGSVLATEEEKSDMLGRYIPFGLLGHIQRYICEWMSREVAGVYAGPFGVDMMIVKTDGGLSVNPCVEINLRRTMGHVALALSPSSRGQQCIMNIGYEGTSYHMRIMNDHELLY